MDRVKLISALALGALLATHVAFGQADQPDGPANGAQIIEVPAGTQLRVDLWDRNIAWPVQSGFTVLIPALAPVSFNSTASQQVLCGDLGNIYLPPQKTIQLTSIAVDGKSYQVEAETITVPENEREVVITLRSSLRISR